MPDTETKKEEVFISVPKELFNSILSALKRLAYSRAGTDSAAEILLKKLESLSDITEPEDKKVLSIDDLEDLEEFVEKQFKAPTEPQKTQND